MKLLIIGNSDLVNRKILPAATKVSKIKSIDIASKSLKTNNNQNLNHLYKDYKSGLTRSEADTVYVSLPNSMHYEYSIKALNHGKNVIVDKPAIIEPWQLEKVYSLAKKNNLAISMSCVFNYHKAWKKFKQISLTEGQQGTLLASFTIPKLPINNIRMSNKLSGGAINDMGIYASSLGYLFWGKKAKSVKVNTFKEKKLVVGFTVSSNFGNGKDFIGHFGFDKIYTNKVQFSNSNSISEYKRVFSPPADFKTSITKRTNSDTKEYLVGKDDSFKNFFVRLINEMEASKAGVRNEFNELNSEYLKILK
jgi:predicted dehydrogenase